MASGQIPSGSRVMNSPPLNDKTLWDHGLHLSIATIYRAHSSGLLLLLWLLSRVWLFMDPKDCGPLGSSVHGIFQEVIPEWVAIPFSRGSSQSRDRTQVSHVAGGFFTS